MNIPSVAALLPASANHAQAEAASADEPVTAKADFKSFLTLLTAQLRNQDPLQPLDSTQFVAQLASFSTVEQIIGTNSRLDRLAEQAGAAELSGFTQWLGRGASAVDGRFRAAGGPEAFHVPSLPGSEWVEGIVLRPDGREVDRFAVVPDASGQAVWPGAATVGLAPGTDLRIELAYHGAGVVQDRRPAAVFREVTGVRGTSDGPILDLAGGGTLRPWEVAELRTSGG